MKRNRFDSFLFWCVRRSKLVGVVFLFFLVQVARMGVRPMSPSANFTTYNLPPSGRNSAKNEDAFGHHSYTLPRPKATSSSLLRFLLCSRPCFQQAVDIHRDDAPVDLDLENGHSCTLDGGSNDEDWSLRTELQVRFLDFLSRFAECVQNCVQSVCRAWSAFRTDLATYQLG